MQKQGYRQSTIQASLQALKGIARRANLLDPESAKAYLGLAKLSENRKGKLADDLARFYRYMRVRFEKPRYRRVDTLPFVPTEAEVDQLISGVGKKTAAFLRLLKETGMRPGEAWNLSWIDIDSERAAVTVTPEKGSKARHLKISNQLGFSQSNATARTSKSSGDELQIDSRTREYGKRASRHSATGKPQPSTTRPETFSTSCRC